MNSTAKRQTPRAGNGERRQAKDISHRTAKLIAYDLLVLLFSFWLLAFLNPSATTKLSMGDIVIQYAVAALCITVWRNIGKIYAQVWRYSRTNSFLRLILIDCCGSGTYIGLAYLLPTEHFTFLRMATICALNLLGAITIRLIYTWIFDIGTNNLHVQRFFNRKSAGVTLISRLVFWMTGISLKAEAAEYAMPESSKIRIAIVGAGRIGTSLAEDLVYNANAVYTPVCFVDVDREKIGRQIAGIPVLPEGEGVKEALAGLGVQEIVFAVNKETEAQTALFAKYKSMGYKIKTYTLPVGNNSDDGKRQIREFEVEELLFRSQMEYLNQSTKDYYRDKVVLISGGGGSIGSELARQIARMKPKQLILLDIYENNLYDVQQEMRLVFGDELNLAVEIASVRDAEQLDKVFRTYRPDVVLHAAAHKHVPLMEHNCSEAVKNNVFGTWNMVNAAEKYAVRKFVMISTDKAVNPTNVMGATKRLCEMIVLSRGKEMAQRGGVTQFSATRFGNVLGSNGSVIPLFKRQIANGGPITLTDRRIIRYFMTIPEASQLVLTSGAMARNGELFVLDMGRPVKILDLAENMIKLSGLIPYQDINIIETGLRPGEKLYEELLIKSEDRSRTENSMIFIERDEPVERGVIEAKLELLRQALSTEDDDQIRRAMKRAVPTYHNPVSVNKAALESGAYEEEAKGLAAKSAAG